MSHVPCCAVNFSTKTENRSDLLQSLHVGEDCPLLCAAAGWRLVSSTLLAELWIADFAF